MLQGEANTEHSGKGKLFVYARSPQSQPDRGKAVSTMGRRFQGTAGNLGLTVLRDS